MIVLAAVGSLAFILVGGFIGARLLLLSRKTKKLPEFLIGLSLFMFSAVVQPAVVASRALGEQFGNNVRLATLSLALLGITIVVACLLRFTMVVFRPNSNLAKWGARTGTSAIAIASVILLWSLSRAEVGSGYSIPTQISLVSLTIIFLIAMSWIAIESLYYRSLLLRRSALGLADPVLVNRFGLWGSGCAGASLSSIGTIACVAAGLNIASHPIPLLNTAIAGTWIAGAWYLSMLAPESYLRWVRERAARSGS